MAVSFKVAGIQMSCNVGDVKGNVEKGCRMIEEAVKEKVQLVCLPEMFNTGYFARAGRLDANYWDLAEPLEDSWTLRQVGDLAKKFQIHVVAPFVEKGGPGVCFNSAALINPEGQVIGCYRKAHIPFSMTGWEKFYFRPGYGFPVFPTSLGKIGIQICYDRDFPEGFRTLALKGAELILLPTGAPRNLAEVWRMTNRIRAYENGLFVLGVGLVGKIDEEHPGFAGNSILAGPRGEILAALEFEEGILVGEVNLGAVEEARRLRFALRDRRPEMYGKLIEMM
jgi:predicted amidohydrolase